MSPRGTYPSAVNTMTAYALGLELDALLTGRTVEETSRFAGGMTIAFSGDGRRFLHLVTVGRESDILITEDRLMPEAAASPFFADLSGARVSSVEPLGLERVILVRLERTGDWGEEGGLLLRIDLSPVFRTAALFREGAPRPAETFGAPGSRPPGSPGQLPPPRRWSLLGLPAGWKLESGPDETQGAEGHTKIWKEKKALAELLTSTVAGVDPVLSRALAERYISDPAGLASDLGDISAALTSKRFEWRVYDLEASGGRGSGAVYPVALPFDPRPGSPESIFEVLDARAAEKTVPAWKEQLRRTASKEVRRDLKKARRMLSNVGDDLESARRAGEFRRMGNLLVTWRHRMRKGMSEITGMDFNGEDEVTIPLEPAAGPEKNIQSYFRRAKKGEKGLEIIKARRSKIREDMTALERKLEEIESSSDLEALAAMAGPRKGQAARRREKEESGPRFKSFPVDGTHTILVGRNDRENDELTHRYAAPTDLWFHAQGSPGSHVVLRGANRSTPAGVIEKAAETAAWFSKARGSGTVPVICAEKKYVRRPRGAKPGTAVCQRSRTLFVTPRLPGEGP